MRMDRVVRKTLCLVLALLLVPVLGLAQSETKGPINKQGLLEALRIGGLTTAELVQVVERRGVDFPVGSEEERELRAAGAQTELIYAVRKSYRVPASAAPVTPSAPAGPTAPAGPAGPTISLREIHKIFIEKMDNDLDQYLRAEITKQLNGRMVVVLTKEDADAIMTGASVNKTGTGAAITGRYLGLHDNATGAISITDRAGKVVLWSSEAGDRSLLVGAMKRGGPRKVADRLIHKLRETMDGK